MSTWYIRAIGSHDPVGPVTADVVTKGVLTGQVPVDVDVCKVGGTEWLPLASLPEFREAVRKVAPPPPTRTAQSHATSEGEFELDIEEAAPIEQERFFLRNRRGAERGTYSVAGLASAFQEGKLPGAMLVRKDGERNVLPLAVFLARRGLDTADDERFFLRDGAGVERGPYSVTVLAGTFRSGTLPDDATVRKDGARTVIPVRLFLLAHGADIDESMVPSKPSTPLSVVAGAPGANASSPTAENPRIFSQRLVFLAIAGTGMISTFLPWVTLGAISVVGSTGDGWFSFVFFLIAGIIAGLGDRDRPTSTPATLGIAACGALSTALAVWKLISIMTIGDGAETGLAKALADATSPGIGLVLCLAAGLGLLGYALFVNPKSPSAGRTK